MGAQSLTLLTFNSRGLRDYNKRNNLFFWLKEKGTDIAFLQEIYWTETCLKRSNKSGMDKLFWIMELNIVEEQQCYSRKNFLLI